MSCGALRTTSSVSVAPYPRDSDSALALLLRVDEALDAARRAMTFSVSALAERMAELFKPSSAFRG
ncbi:hypothetical protein [Stutzerimonas xanthomarina]|uniref:hypothetical protein n=1 Tax=Stutzerimonas xanthomarina TaxID=271420 RepID=UPI0018D286C4|nr:hypothetical protein [Stutzerimonas xanthomarina]MCP9340475.1 hypothetical protein [Stutzerimonas xanthomarina]